MRKSFVYRLYPTKAQATAMIRTLDECRWLYNHLLEERKTAWEEQHKSISMYEQQKTLPPLKAERTSLCDVHSQALQDVCSRLDLAMKAFFRRVKAGDKAGYPRFRGVGRYDSFTYPQAPSGCKLVGKALHLSKVGTVRVVLHRPLEGKPKTCTIRRSSTNKWYAVFSCDVPDPLPLPSSPEAVGIDVGLTTFAMISNGETIANPRFFRTEEKSLAQVQRRLSKEQKGTPERRKRRKPVARVHERVRFRRHNFVHQEARRIVNRYGFIAVEDLSINRMSEDRKFAKGIYDASWGMFAKVLSEKAACATRTYVAVNPAYTSQDCHQCHARQMMPLNQRIYRCQNCGVEMDRDLNAALNILALGQQSMGKVP